LRINGINRRTATLISSLIFLHNAVRKVKVIESIICKTTSPLFERIELLLPWQPPGVSAFFLTRTKAVQTLSMVCFPEKRRESWTHVVLILLGFGLGFDHKETTETHSILNRSPQQ
jgi:hypothetical protein